MHKRTVYLLASVVILLAYTAEALGALRIDDLRPSGHTLIDGVQRWCVRVREHQNLPVVVMDGVALAEHRVKRVGNTLCFDLPHDINSGPLWLREGGRTSNSVWLSIRKSWVLSPSRGRLAKIADRVVTDLELVSLVMHEEVDGLEQARRIAHQYRLEITGAIPPLNVYQVRLPTTSLAARNRLLNRLSSDPAVVGVVVEDDNLETPEDPERPIEPPDQEGWVANNLDQAVEAYRHNILERGQNTRSTAVIVGVIEGGVDFDSTDFASLAQPCKGSGTCLYARHSTAANWHGSIVSGILAARLYRHGNVAFLSRLGALGGRFDIIVDRGAASGVTARIAASVNLVEDGARVLNWSWGVHRMGTLNLRGGPIDTNVRSDEAMTGYALLLERFFNWLKRHHRNVVVVNSAGNSASSTDDHLPASIPSDQLIVVGGHQRSGRLVGIADPLFAAPRRTSNVGPRIDISAAACPDPPRSTMPRTGRGGGCGTSYAAALVTGVVAAMISINPHLSPRQVKHLLRESALPMVARVDQERPVGSTQPTHTGGRHTSGAIAVEQFARLDMYRALMFVFQRQERSLMTDNRSDEIHKSHDGKQTN